MPNGCWAWHFARPSCYTALGSMSLYNGSYFSWSLLVMGFMREKKGFQCEIHRSINNYFFNILTFKIHYKKRIKKEFLTCIFYIFPHFFLPHF